MSLIRLPLFGSLCRRLGFLKLDLLRIIFHIVALALSFCTLARTEDFVCSHVWCPDKRRFTFWTDDCFVLLFDGVFSGFLDSLIDSKLV